MRGYVSDAANEGGAAAIEADGHPPTPVAGPLSKPIPNVLVLDNVPACPENPPAHRVSAGGPRLPLSALSSHER